MDSTATTPIETPRLTLRGVLPSDATAIVALVGDWDVARMLADMPHPLTLDQARLWTQPEAGENAYAILRNGQMIGGVSVCGLGNRPTDVEVPACGAELGFWLGRAWWGSGYAREAAGAAIAHAFVNARVPALHSGRFVDNPASHRVLTALGFVATGTSTQWCLARGSVVACVRYELHRHHWRQSLGGIAAVPAEAMR